MFKHIGNDEWKVALRDNLLLVAKLNDTFGYLADILVR